MALKDKSHHKFDNDPPHQEKGLQEGAPYPTNALPVNHADITDRDIRVAQPYNGSFSNVTGGEFKHTATGRQTDETEGPGITVSLKVKK